MTYSLVARDPQTGELGVAVQSHWFAVGPVVTHARAGVGAVATQSVPEPTHGPRLLELLAGGASPQEALAAVLEGDEGAGYRQTALVDARGRVAVHTGPGCMADAGHVTGDGWSAQANMMASPDVWPAMAQAFEGAAPALPLAERLVIALDAAQAAGGDVRGQQSAALLVVAPEGPPVDVRVDDHPEAVAEVRRLLVLHRAYALATAGDEAMAEGRTRDMIEAYEEAGRLAPDNPELLFWAGLALAYDGDREGGADRVRRAVEANPGLRRLLERLTEDVAPAVQSVRDAL